MKDDVNKTTAFRRLYKAHDIIADLNERVISLYSSAAYASPKLDGMPKSQPNPQRFENTMIKITELQENIDKLLQQRIKFDVFVSMLSYEKYHLLKMRFEDNLLWKEIADKLNKSEHHAKRLYKNICAEAEKVGIFDPLE